MPWRAWEAESYKLARTLHDADRESVTFEPDVGFHEDVVKVDFASLFPNIMCVNNLSPETVRCDCHDTDDMPGLGYSVCDRPGFVPAFFSRLSTTAPRSNTGFRRRMIRTSASASKDDQRR